MTTIIFSSINQAFTVRRRPHQHTRAGYLPRMNHRETTLLYTARVT